MSVEKDCGDVCEDDDNDDSDDRCYRMAVHCDGGGDDVCYHGENVEKWGGAYEHTTVFFMAT